MKSPWKLPASDGFEFLVDFVVCAPLDAGLESVDCLAQFGRNLLGRRFGCTHLLDTSTNEDPLPYSRHLRPLGFEERPYFPVVPIGVGAISAATQRLARLLRQFSPRIVFIYSEMSSSDSTPSTATSATEIAPSNETAKPARLLTGGCMCKSVRYKINRDQCQERMNMSMSVP